MKQPVVPSRAEFLQSARAAFAFLRDYGFVEVAGPNHRQDPFQVWFQADTRSVVLRGEGYGSTASVTLETSDGREAALVYFVPQSQRQDGKRINGQLEYVHFLAAQVGAHAADFLAGRMETFDRIAKEQPQWKRQA